MHTRHAAALGALSLAIATPGAQAAQARPDAIIEQLLRAAGAYVEQYERAVSAIVAQEDYRQILLADRQAAPAARTMRSDLLVFDAGRSGWVSFRDVYEVDGSPVRDHDQRLAELLTHFAPESMVEAKRIAAEGARFNLNAKGFAIDRNINTPMTALLFLRTSGQGRSTFELGKGEEIDGLRTVALRFTEQIKPRLIGTHDQAAAHGAFWIDPMTGRVVRSELQLESGGDREPFVMMRIAVTYAHVPSLDVWMPVTMDESYDLPAIQQAIKGHADYSHFRQFSVTVDANGR